MQAWTVHNFGHYKEQLKLEERDPPQIKGSDALIEVKAIGINFFDLLTIAGKYQVKAPLPFVPGGEAAGEVVAVGDDCALKVGERVMTNHSGTFAEYMTAPHNAVFHLPEKMSYEDAAAFQLIY